MKILEQIISNRIRIKVEHKLNEQQAGFRKGRSTQDHLFTLQQIAEKIHKKKEKYT